MPSLATPEIAVSLTSLPFPLVLVGIVAIGTVVIFLLRTISGWASLARFYRVQGRFAGKTNGFCSGSMNGVGFNNSLITGADQDGLYLATLFPFSLGFPSLLIPWEDITATPTKIFLFRSVKFRFRQVPSVALTVSEALGRKLLSANPLPPGIP